MPSRKVWAACTCFLLNRELYALFWKLFLSVYMQVFLFVAWNRYLHTFFTSGTWAPYTFFFCILSFIHFFLLKELELHTPSFWNLSCGHFISPATLTWTVRFVCLVEKFELCKPFPSETWAVYAFSFCILSCIHVFAFWRGLRCVQWPKLLQKETGLKFQKILLKCQK